MKQIYLEELKEKLKLILHKKTFTQNDVACKLNVTQAQISQFINGKRGLGGEATLRLLKFIDEQNALD